MSDWSLSLRHLVKYPDCNATHNLFGGEMLKWIDEGAGMYAACQMKTNHLVTAHMDALDFRAPAPKGSVCSVYCKTAKEGRSSITVDIKVTTNPMSGGDETLVTLTQMVFVSTDAEGRPTPWR